ncbi:vesicle transport through interaction with t-SNAREs homolog 1A isoform X4 [Elephas maximus indicus]|uniref:vesicle transport through interaction with t-SNAREs homolog 1A isoform X4 n=1 Tax=Elephas maximus indicus TaxID=99487 RepID=UPI002116886F|nr:vesicle transport through interaction with t-SNAREs homolog 1A isoform X4 [Elephas maximus indicus]
MISVIPEHPHIFVGLKKKKTNRSIFFFVDFLILKPRRKIKSLPSWISGGPRLQRTTGKRLGWELSPGSLLLLRAFPGSLRPRALSREVPGPILASARAGQSGAAMSSDFEGYEQDFAVLTAEITNKIARVPRLPPDEKKQMVANVEKQLEEAKELLEQMDLEVREIPPQSRGMYSNRMRSYKQEMGKLETDFKRSRIAYSDEVRNELLGDDGNSSENQLIKLREERAHLLDNTERLERSSRRLEAGYQIAVETEQIGQEMLENLSHDREKIQRARERLRETDANLGKSSRILTGMLRRSGHCYSLCQFTNHLLPVYYICIKCIRSHALLNQRTVTLC